MKLVFNRNVISAFLTFVILIVTLLYYLHFPNDARHKSSLKRSSKNTKKGMNKLHSEDIVVMITEKIVHLDLKGAPPKVSYYSQLFPLLKKLGATGILLEYEDMFPYQGPKLQNSSALNAYTVQDIKTINKLAQEHKLKVIPFIQVFGHIDFLLKLEEYTEYREIWNFPSTICPSYNKTLNLLEEMIKQVVDAHSDSNMIHIGCDEVPHLGKEIYGDINVMHDLGHCQRCINRMTSHKLTKHGLFLDHVRSIIDIIKRKKPALEILIWDDNFRTLKAEEIQRDFMTKSFKPVVWWYGKDVYDELGPSLWNMYSNIFPSVWLASAYKGAIGSNKYISDVNHYIQNHKSWLSVIEEYHHKLHFDGIILTGRQRYDHFAVLCELLPVGIPALAMNLRLLQGFKDSALGPPLEVAKILECEQPYGLIGAAFGSPKCKFPGGDILENIIHFHQLVQEFEEISEDSRVKGWLSEYNKAYSFSNPRHVKSVLMPLDKIKGELEFIKGRISKSMLEVYDQYTVDEWLDTNLLPFEKKVQSMWEAKQTILAKMHWPQRPLNFNKEL